METADNPARNRAPSRARPARPNGAGAPSAPPDQAEQAYQALLDHLRQGRLASGMFLSMPLLVAQLGFPLAATREAVKRAEAAALVSILPKRGLMVMRADAATTRDCMELRAMLDIHGAQGLLARGESLPLAALRRAHEALRDEAAALPPGSTVQRRAIETDLSLHDLLATGLDGPLLPRLYADNRNRIAVIQTQRPFLTDRIVPAMTEHLAILTALEARDMTAVQQSLWDHLTHTLRWWGIDARGSAPAPGCLP